MAVARVVAWDSRPGLVALNSLTPLLYLPAWPVAVGAAAARRWRLAAVAALMVTAHVAFVGPELAARSPRPAVPAGAFRFRLFDANVFVRNDRPAELAKELRAAAPDVVFLQEATPALFTALAGDGALDGLPYRAQVSRTDPFAGLLASRWPLTDDELVEAQGRTVTIRATAMTPGGPIRLYAVHTLAPVAGGSRNQWIADLRRLADQVRAERLPVLVAGDFNATWGHKAFRDVLGAGLTDAAAARGHPFSMTWPRGHAFPPLARIDHVLTGDGLTVTAIRTGQGAGSDHRPLVADVAATSATRP